MQVSNYCCLITRQIVSSEIKVTNMGVAPCFYFMHMYNSCFNFILNKYSGFISTESTITESTFGVSHYWCSYNPT